MADGAMTDNILVHTKGEENILSFSVEGKLLGRLYVKDGLLHFEGDADNTALAMFDAFGHLVERFLDPK